MVSRLQADGQVSNLDLVITLEQDDSHEQGAGTEASAHENHHELRKNEERRHSQPHEEEHDPVEV